MAHQVPFHDRSLMERASVTTKGAEPAQEDGKSARWINIPSQLAEATTTDKGEKQTSTETKSARKILASGLR